MFVFAHLPACRSLMLALDPVPSSTTQVALKWFGATTDPLESENTLYIKDTPSTDPRVGWCRGGGCEGV